MSKEYSSSELLQISEMVSENLSEPYRTEALKFIRIQYDRARIKEEAASRIRQDTAQIKRIRALYDGPSSLGAKAERTECHVCDGRGEYSGRTGRRRCNRCYGKGYL